MSFGSDPPDAQLKLEPIEHELQWHVKRNLSLENCLKKVQDATFALTKEWIHSA